MTTHKFGHDAVTEMLYQMSLDGWFTSSSGDVESPFGWFAYTDIAPNEIAEIREAFDDDIPDVLAQIDDADLVGGWMLYEDSQGFVSSVRYDRVEHAPIARQHVAIAYAALVAEYLEWCDDDAETVTP